MNRTSAIVSMSTLVAVASITKAVTVENFDNWLPDSVYANWPSGNLIENPTNFEVQATGFGGGYANIGDPFIVDATGQTTLQLTATVKTGVAGFLVVLGDTTGHEWNYAWYGNTTTGGTDGTGEYLLTKPLNSFNFSTGAAGQFDFSNIDYMHVQVDPGGPNLHTPYDVTYNDLSIVGGVASLSWNNAGGTGDGVTWDVGVNQNWSNGSGPATFSQGDNVTFGSTNNGHTNVTVNTVVNPASTTVNGAAAYTFSGTGGIGGAGGLTVTDSATLTLNTANTYAGPTTVNTGATLNVNGSIPATALSAGGHVVFGASSATGILARSIGPISVTSGGKVSVAAPSAPSNRTVLVTTGLTFGGTAPAYEGVVDLGANDMIVRGAVAATIRSELKAGLAGTAGITTSAATSSNSTRLGYAAIAAAGTFDGQAVASGDVVIKYTILGDATLDGTVNFNDLVALAQNYGGANTIWSSGDFNYDGTTDFNDLVGLAQNYNKVLSASEVTALGSSFAADYALARSLVPEPGVLSIVGFGAIKLLSRSRRSKRSA